MELLNEHARLVKERRPGNGIPAKEFKQRWEEIDKRNGGEIDWEKIGRMGRGESAPQRCSSGSTISGGQIPSRCGHRGELDALPAPRPRRSSGIHFHADGALSGSGESASRCAEGNAPYSGSGNGGSSAALAGGEGVNIRGG
jgi:hypothetical protein